MNRAFAYIIVAALLLSMPHASAFTLGEQGTFTYPTIWADVPDPDVIRVGDAYYMTSTTMHMNPGVPIMKSTDLVNWEIVNYVYDILAEDDKQTLSNGENEYSRGSWASSLRYHNGRYYVAFASYSTGKTYIYQTADVENGPWTRSVLDRVYHDMSLLFDDDGRVYMVYGSANIYVIELTADATAIKGGGVDQLIIPDVGRIVGQSFYVAGEGAHVYKLNGQYYVFLISWPAGGMRTELCYRAGSITGAYEGRVVFSDSGVAQGGIVDTPDGQWYAVLFQDHGAVGRIPYIVPVSWEYNWPVFGNAGTMPDTTIPEIGPASNYYVTASDEFYQGMTYDSGSDLPLVWQWNHNPDNEKWSLAERPGYLRLKTGQISTSILDARNTLTQRTFGPDCSGRIAMDISHMKNGDYAGLAAFQYYYGYVGVKMVDGQKYVVMVRGSSNQSDVESIPVEIQALPVYQDRVYLKVEFDFNDMTDKAYFYYSLDGAFWTEIGESLQMVYLLKHFMGYRFGLFNYATTTTGGYVDIDYFRLDGQMTGVN